MNCTVEEMQEEKGTAMPRKIAKIIRFITVPPLMVAALLTVLLFGADVFPAFLDYALTMLFLAVVPVLAYAAQKILPGFKEGGQKAQRKLAFVFSFVGYGAAVLTAVLRDAIPNLLYIAVVYLASVILLTLFNAFTPWRASGHACSLMGPIVLICLFIGWYAVPVALGLYAASFWASVYMKRHTVSEFLLGSLCAVLSALICYLFIHPVF